MHLQHFSIFLSSLVDSWNSKRNMNVAKLFVKVWWGALERLSDESSTSNNALT